MLDIYSNFFLNIKDNINMRIYAIFNIPSPKALLKYHCSGNISLYHNIPSEEIKYVVKLVIIIKK